VAAELRAPAVASTRLGGSRLLAYGALALPLAALNLPLYLILPTFYAAERGLGLAAVGAALLAARLFDALTDPLIGEASDRLRRRLPRKLWVLAASPLLVLASWQLFVPAEGVGVGHLLLWTCAAYLAWTAVILPYQAMGAEISDDPNERSRLAGAREAFVLLGILLAAATPTLVQAAGWTGHGATLAALFVGMSLLLPLGLVLLWTVPEPAQAAPAPGPGLVQGFRLLGQNRPFARLLAAFVLNGIANGLPATLFLLFVTHGLDRPDAAGPLLLLYFVAGIAGIPLWLKLSYRIGKARAWATAMLSACLVFAFVPLLGPGDLTAFALICLLSGLSLGADLALPASIQADIIDADRKAVGRWRSGLFFAVWSMASKLALALAAGIALPLLQLAGFRTDGANGASALLALALLYAALPVLLKLAATALVWRLRASP
jgi:Na+/melibiose symporter-like transporter